MKTENEVCHPEGFYRKTSRYSLLIPCLICSLLLYYLLIFQENIFFQQSQVLALFILVLTTFIFFGTTVYLNSRHQNRIKNHLMIMVNNIDRPFVATSLRGTILFKNDRFIHHFPHIDLQIQELLPHINNKDAREKLHDYLTSAIKEESLDTLVNIVMQNKSLKSYNLSCKRRKNIILWTLIEEDIIKQKYLFYGNDYQKSLDAKLLFNRTPTGNVIIDQDGCIQGYNATFKKFVLNKNIPIGAPFKDLLSPACQFDLNFDFLRVLNQHKSNVPIEFEFEKGKVAFAYFNKIEFPDISQEFSHKGYILQFFDHNEHKKYQQRLSQSQKLQALGQLAGGIAHDFNNLLTAMMGYCDLLLLRHSPGEQSFTEIMQIKQNVTRATNLIKQLLAFSRKQTLQPSIIDVSETLAELFSMLKRIIGSSINLKITHGHNLDYIKADRGQFEQVITNLIVNARDAIKESGTILLITSNRSIEQPTPISHEVIQPGTYVQIEVIDDGEGIDLQHVNQIFDPFFTTKDNGSGTGLGLSTVYGIIKQTGGYITVESTLKIGTKFTILLPKVEKQAATILSLAQEQGSDQLFRDLTGSGTILLVEDEDAVRLCAARALSAKGYTVIEAHNGYEALSYLRNVKKFEEIPQLLITDVIMPKMEGPQLAKEALKLYPSLRVIYVSGYAEDAFRAQISQDEKIQFLPKPFSLKSLAIKVREAFDQIENRKLEDSYHQGAENSNELRTTRVHLS